MIWRAHVADKYVKKLRKLHPIWGDGSLRAAALVFERANQARPFHEEYEVALAMVLSEISQRRGQSKQFYDLKRVCIEPNKH